MMRLVFLAGLFYFYGRIAAQGLKKPRKSSHRVIPKGWVCPRNLLFRAFGEEKQILRSPRRPQDDKNALFSQPVTPDFLEAMSLRLKPRPTKIVHERASRS
jgi:hypothetical protein